MKCITIKTYKVFYMIKIIEDMITDFGFRVTIIKIKTETYKHLYDFIITNTNFLNEYDTSIGDRLKYLLANKTNINTCTNCGNPIVNIKRKYCSKNCVDTCQILKNQKIETSITKYGTTNVSKSQYFKDKYRNHMMETYGVEHYSKVDNFVTKTKKTKLERYGNENYNNMDKHVATCNLNYGVDYYLSTAESKHKRKETLINIYGVDHNSKIDGRYDMMKKKSIIKYGVEHPMKHPDIKHKAMTQLQNSLYRFKPFTFPSGLTIKIQGYEWLALNELLQEGISESSIVTDRNIIPRIPYTTTDGIEHIYYPDIFIPSLNKIIEVKSVYTYNNTLELNVLKKNASEKLGYDFEFRIYEEFYENGIYKHIRMFPIEDGKTI